VPIRSFRLARFAAEKEDRAGVLRQLRDMLALRLPELAPQNARDDDLLRAWNEDADFQKLYAEFEPKNDGSP
jgi:hypothetical protein